MFTLLTVALALVAGTVSGAVVLARRSRLRRQLVAAIRPIQDREMVTVIGVVRALEPLEAPLAGTPCVVYLTLIKLRQEVIGSTADDLVHGKQELAPFELVTEQGVVRVEGPEFELLHYASVPIIPRPLQRQRALLDQHGLADEPLDQTSFEEVRIAAGDRISVHGMALVESDPTAPDAGYRHLPTATRLVSREGHPLLIDRVG